MPINNAGIIAGLTQLANTFVGYMKDNIRSKNVPSRVSDAISITPAVATEAGGSIDVVVNMKAAPMAAAYEWGSGIHATRGSANKYPIVPRNANKLIFPRSRWPKYSPPPDVDPIVLNKVSHPGVAARPYISPILDDPQKMNDLVRLVGDSVVATLLADMNVITIIEVRM